MKTHIPLLALALMFVGSFCVHAQDGTVDPSFHVVDREIGRGFYGQIHDLIIQDDGKFIMVGNFFTSGENLTKGIARRTAQGKFDPTFNPGLGFDDTDLNPQPRVLLIQPDGKYLVAGDFSEYNGSPAGRIIRINDDGTRDETYSMGSGFNQEVNSMAWLPDGKLLVGGKFTTYNGVPARYLVRLNQDGTLDQSLKIAGLLEVALVKVQPDGKILVNSGSSLFRLQADGSVDPSFTHFGDGDFNTTFRLRLHDMEVVEEGKILISGDIFDSFTSYSIIRLNQNGTLDETFKLTARGGKGYDLEVDGEGMIYTYGFYSAVAGEDDTFYTDLKRLFPDGTVDPSFDLNPPYSRPTYYEGQTLVLQEDGKLLVDPNETLVRFNTDGTLDPTFNPAPDFNGEVNDIVIQEDGKMVVVGIFSTYNGILVNRIARLNPDGTLDNSFETGKGIEFKEMEWEYSNNDGVPRGVVMQEDGKYLVYGDFNFYNGKYAKNIVRINPDGSTDMSFDPFPAPRNPIGAVELQPDGKILLGSSSRLLADGTKDPSFDMGTGFNGEYGPQNPNLLVLEDGKILATGSFSIYNNTPVKPFVRLFPDGALDTGFSVNVSSFQSFGLPLEQADGKIIVPVRDSLMNRLVRFNADGSLDASFDSEWVDEDPISHLLLQWDGKILGVSQKGKKLVRLHPDGRIDATFKTGETEDGFIQAIALQPDRNIVVGGDFSLFNGDIRNNIVRLLNTGDIPINLTEVVRINSGGGAMEWEGEYWQADTLYEGGRRNSTTEDILFTEKDFLYQTERYGDFTYAIPVPEEGLYTVELYFSEIHWQRPNARIFNFSLENDQMRLSLDLFRELGGRNRPMTVTAENIKVEDGYLSLDMITEKDRAKLSGIAVFRQKAKSISEDIRINAGGPTLFHKGEIWHADQNFQGGRTYLNDSQDIKNTENDALYQTERYGEFRYDIPVPEPGFYSMELHFAEIHWSRENARRFGFEVQHEQYILKDIDLFKNYGGSHSASKITIDSVFAHNESIVVWFETQKNNAKVSGIHLYKQKGRQDPNLPAIINLSDIEIETGKQVMYQVEVSNAQPGDIWFAAEDLPAGLSIDPFTGIISGQTATLGKFLVTLQIKDKENNRSAATFNVTVIPWEEIRINAGGGAIIKGDKYWMADNFYSGGISFIPSSPLVLPEDQLGNEALYESERISAGVAGFSYQIPVLENGYFTVELYMRTTPDPAGVDKNPGSGFFYIVIENGRGYGESYNRTGNDGAWVQTLNTVEVTDGFLNLDMESYRVNPRIAGIVVKRENTLPPFYRIDSGGEGFYGYHRWTGDEFYSGGKVHRDISIPINNPIDARLYQSERFGDFSYSIPALEEGLYTVELHFAEIYWNQAGARIFDITVENGQFISESIDLFQQYGPRTPGIMIAENIEVKDGFLDISVKKKVNNPSLAGIVMYRQRKPTDGVQSENLRYISREVYDPKVDEPSSIKSSETKIFPNPARDRFNIEFQADRAGEWGFTLVNPLGTGFILDRMNLEKGVHTLEFDIIPYRLSPGVYYLQIINERAIQQVVKVIIQ